MSMYVVYQDADGSLVSAGTVVADPLPSGLMSMQLSESDSQDFRSGLLVWDAETLSLVAAPPPSQDPPTREESAALAARLTVVDKVRADTLDDDTVAGLVSIFPDWSVGIAVAVGEVYAYDGTLVECLQAHTSQADWTPPATPSLWKLHRTDDGTTPLAWLPGLALTLGDQVTYDGILYDVTQAHTTQEGWEPPNVPTLFTPVEV